MDILRNIELRQINIKLLNNALITLIEQGKINYASAVRYGLTPKLTEEAMYNYALCTYQSSSALGESVRSSSFIRSRSILPETAMVAPGSSLASQPASSGATAFFMVSEDVPSEKPIV